MRMNRRFARNAAVLVGITLVALELVARLTFAAFAGQPFDPTALERTRDARLTTLDSRLGESAAAAAAASEGSGPAAGSGSLFQLHPYLGYTGRPGAHPWSHEETPFNSFGFLSVAGHAYPYHRKADELVVGVFGGSVAEGFANLGAAELGRTLSALLPELANRDVVTLPLAAGGYKQPQQLILLEYALLEGFDLDAVINLDGFNDVVLAAENSSLGTSPVWPSSGHYQLLVAGTTNTTDPHRVAVLDSIYEQYRSERRLLALAQAPALSRSALLALVAEVYSGASAARVQELNRELLEGARAQAAGQDAIAPPSSTGTPESAESTAASDLAEAVEIWRSSSRMMLSVCENSGLVYVHGLQPNQYVEGGKRLTDEERRLAYQPDNPWSVLASEGYPALQQAGAELKAQGVPFYDLTGAFSTYKGSLYTDECCHFSRVGHEILAREIAAALATEIRRQGRSR